MKKTLFALSLLLTSQMALQAADKPVQVNQMPKKAQAFITTYFPSEKVAFSSVDTDMMGNEYKVIFANGQVAEFDKKGEWTEVDAKTSTVPAGVVPALIQNYLKTSHPDAKVAKIERDRTGYELKLANGIEVKFDAKQNIVGYDD